jgi:hypothetical protein
VTIKAWHFLGGNDKPLLRDDTPLVVGEWLEYKGELELCASGYHASIRAIDALQYAPGNWVSLVEVEGEIILGNDKLVASRRKALWCYDASEQLGKFARQCALDVVHLWDAPAVVIEYLNTGDEAKRAAAWAAARAAALDAAAARDAARDAARAAAWAAARAAARDAARADAWAAARDAAWADALDAAPTWAAAWAAARDKQNRNLESLLLAGVTK